MKYFYQPLKPFIINQYFGENKACISTDGLNKYISCDGLNPPYGYKTLYGTKGHLGIDLKASKGQEVYCSQGGKVVHIDTNPKSGLDVKIRTEMGGRIFKHIYEHLLGYQCNIGDIIETGQLVGWADNTGYSSGNHLHFEVQELTDTWNSIDPLPLMEPIFAKDILWLKNKIKFIREEIAKLLDNFAFKLRVYH